MKNVILFAFTFLFIACGPNKKQLRAELHSIEAEMVSLRIAAEQQRAHMDEAEFNAFIGTFSTGYGLTSGDYELAGDGAGAVVDSSRQYGVSSYSHQQLVGRYETLLERRTAIVAQLK